MNDEIIGFLILLGVPTAVGAVCFYPSLWLYHKIINFRAKLDEKK